MTIRDDANLQQAVFSLRIVCAKLLEEGGQPATLVKLARMGRTLARMAYGPGQMGYGTFDVYLR